MPETITKPSMHMLVQIVLRNILKVAIVRGGLKKNLPGHTLTGSIISILKRRSCLFPGAGNRHCKAGMLYVDKVSVSGGGEDTPGKL